MFKKGSKIYSIINNKCPKCNEGQFFEDNNMLHLKNLLKMNTYCPTCGFKYEIEPAFYYGAMYVSYGLTVGGAIVTFIILWLIGLDLLTIFIGIFIMLILFTPLTLRISRLLYGNIFIHYDPNYKNEDGIKFMNKKKTLTRNSI